MHGLDGTSWNNNRPDGVSFTFQVRKHFVEPQRDVPNNVLKQTPRGPESAHNLEHTAVPNKCLVNHVTLF